MTSLVLSCAVSLPFAYSLLISFLFFVQIRCTLTACLFPPPGKGIPLYPQCLLFTSSCIYSNVSFLVRQSTCFCGIRWWSRRTCAHLLLQELQNYNLPLNNHQLEMFSSVQFSHRSCPTLCDPMNRSTPGLPVHHQLPEFTRIRVHRVSDAIQPSHPLSSPFPPAPNPSQHQSFPMSQLFA